MMVKEYLKQQRTRRTGTTIRKKITTLKYILVVLAWIRHLLDSVPARGRNDVGAGTTAD
jgi:hypothetical protein